MILFYPGSLQANPEAMKQFEAITRDEEVRYLCDEVLDHPLKALTTGQPSAYDPQKLSLPMPFVYFSGYEIADVSRFQNEIEKAGLPIAAMAIATANNQEMLLKDLMEEVGREAAYFAKREELASLLEHIDPVKLQTNPDYFNCAMLAANLLKEEELSEKMLDTALSIMHSFESDQ